jgi:2-hydroxychromene-2-carboxylate isomerase
MNREVEFLFADGSLSSYLASLQIESFAKRTSATVTYCPILLGAVLKATGNASPMTVAAEGRYMAMETATMVVALRHSLQTESQRVYVERAGVDTRCRGGT